MDIAFNRKFYEYIILKKAEEYLKINEERFTKEEKKMFLNGLNEWLYQDLDCMDDVVYDFLINAEIVCGYQKREDRFISYLNNKYGSLRFKKIMDIGAGRMCRLSQSLSKLGGFLYAIDPKIRITQKEASKMGIKSISKQKFLCDDILGEGKGTNIKHIDHLIGLEPCDATEHIIRQGLKYDKPFDILLCANAHDAFDGTKFDSYLKWYEYLKSISSEVMISKTKVGYFATNVSGKQQESAQFEL